LASALILRPALPDPYPSRGKDFRNVEPNVSLIPAVRARLPGGNGRRWDTPCWPDRGNPGAPSQVCRCVSDGSLRTERWSGWARQPQTPREDRVHQPADGAPGRRAKACKPPEACCGSGFRSRFQRPRRGTGCRPSPADWRSVFSIDSSACPAARSPYEPSVSVVGRWATRRFRCNRYTEGLSSVVRAAQVGEGLAMASAACARSW
jgi:hypothetical protein